MFGPVMAAIFRLEDQGFRLSDIRVLREVSRGLKKQCKREPPNLKMRQFTCQDVLRFPQ